MTQHDDSISCLQEPVDDLARRHLADLGWDGTGWYFQDDLGALHGPFGTRDETLSARLVHDRTSQR